LAWKTELDVRFKHASVAAAAGERDGLYWLGRCHRDGEGCEMDPGKAMSFFQRACHLGDVFSMIAIGDMMPDSDPERWRWAGSSLSCWFVFFFFFFLIFFFSFSKGIAALKGNSLRFMLSFAEEVEKYIDGFGNRRSVFYIGRALVGQVDHVEKRIFKSKWFFEARLGVATFAVEFFQSQLAACRMAVDAWSVVGVRFGVVKDIRILIAKLIWEAREEANYLCEEAIEEAEK
jgi:TPR repeat protein